MEDMSEEFVHLNGASGGLTADSLKKEIEKLKAAHAQFEKDRNELEKARSEAEKLEEQIKARSAPLVKRLEDGARAEADLESSWKNNLFKAQEEHDMLLEKRHNLQRQLKEEERRKAILEEEVEISSARPERQVFFKGALSEGKSKECCTEIRPKILYPMSGGTALITFEKAEVAQNVIQQKEHKIQIEECFMRVQACAVELPMPSSVEIDMHVCNFRVMVSSIPENIPEDRIIDKLEIFFGKKKNGGGEVEKCEFLPDSRHVVVTFAEEGVAKSLTCKEVCSFAVENKTYQLKVTPYVNGEIKDLQFRDSICQKTVLLSGIPDIMDEEALQDVLEIHFQKRSNGGGEVELVHYVPLGKGAMAVFEEDVE
ncbi:interferon-induced 35 kDa protein [Lissotriton helveticus]